jgi:hypothetical protein
MRLEPSMRAWRIAGMCLLALGAGMTVSAYVGLPSEGDGKLMATFLVLFWVSPFLIAGAILYGIGLRRRPPR